MVASVGGELSEASLTHALEIVYDPRSKNDVRQDATAFLDRAKESPAAFSHGFVLAADPQRPPILRHYGLSMMLYHLKYTYDGGRDAAASAAAATHSAGADADDAGVSDAQLRESVLRLTSTLGDGDPPYLKNKVVQIWTEVAKRIWGLGWEDMDEQLCNLWGSSALAHRDFVLVVLENLSEDIFSREDYVAAMRQDIGSAFARICVSQAIMEEYYHPAEGVRVLRHGTEGWLLRLSDGLRSFIDQHSRQSSESLRGCVVKGLAAVTSLCSWISPKAIIATNCVETVGLCFAAGDTAMRLAALDAFSSIFSRLNMETEDLSAMVRPLFNRDSLQLLHDAYGWAETGGPDDDDEKYVFAKKLSEMLASLSTLVEVNPEPLEATGNIEIYFDLILKVTRHPSFFVSLPALEVWLRLLRSRTSQFADVVYDAMPPLLELCTSRSMKFDALPDDSEHICLTYLAADCDTLAQRDLILSQYRQACVHTIETVVRREPLDATKHILDAAARFFRELEAKPLDRQTYNKHSMDAMLADTNFTAVEASARGCLKWIAMHADANADQSNKAVEQKRSELEHLFAQWCETGIAFQFSDPDVKRKMLAQIVSISSKVLARYSQTAFSVLDHLLGVRSTKEPSSQQFQDSTKELLETSAYGAQRLATTFADSFLSIYDQLETRIQQIISDEGTDLQARWLPFLIMIIHRASNLDAETRTEKLRSMIQPVKQAWQDAVIDQAVKDYSTFCSFLGWDRLPEYLHNSKYGTIEDWSEKALDEQGLALQQELLNRNDQIPIRITKALLHATTEKLEEGSPIYAIARTIWGEILPSILPNLLKMLSYATQFHNRETWTSFPVETQNVIRRILTDRFWQNGISAESRDAFVNKVNNTKNTYEGFGSTVRRTVRTIRTGACDLLLFLAKLGDVFYGIPNLGQPLSQALYENAIGLSAHHFSLLITVSSTLIKGCDVSLRQQFLPSILASLFQQLRIKVDAEWDVLNHRTEQASADDNLDDEMKNQSILRSMTYNACYLMYTLTNADLYKGETPTPLAIITNDVNILEPIITFAASALRVRDYHSVKSTCVVLHDRLIPLYREPSAVHEYICNDLLKAAITSLHEPYFVELQRDLASLILQIIYTDPNIASGVIASLPVLSEQPGKVRTAIERICACGVDKVGRALVLELLEQIRGVSIHEMGRIGGPKKSKTQTKLLQQFEMQQHEAQVKAATRGDSPGLEGVAQLLQ